jgi:hypothetical protein
MLGYLAGILGARAAGYGAKTILKALGAKSPKWQYATQAAEALGFTSPAILSRMLKGKGGDPEQFMTLHEKTRKQDEKNKRNDYMKVAGTLGAAGAAAYGLHKYANRAPDKGSVTVLPPIGAGGPPRGGPPPGIGGGRQPGLTNQVGTQAQGPQRGQGSGVPPPFGGQPNQSQRSPFTPEKQERQQGLEKLQETANNLPHSLETQYPYLPIFVRKHLQAGVKPEEIYGQLQQSKMLSPVMKRIEQETGEPYLDRIFKLAGMVGTADALAKMGSKENLPIQQLPKDVQAPATFKKSDVVNTPFGAGNVHKTHGDNAYVEVDNKLRKVPLEELENPDERTIQAVSDILQIPEVDRSSNIALFSYDPMDSSMIVQFHNGEIYKYLDIARDKIDILAQKLGIPVTEGENVFGAWSPEDKKSLGAAFWQQILKDPKYAKARKGEPANKYWRKLETPYDYWEKLRKKSKRKK